MTSARKGHDHGRERLGGALIAPALQRVLDLQAQLRGQPANADDLIFSDLHSGEAFDEGRHVGAFVDPPGVGVGVTERQVCLRPQRAVDDRANRARRGFA